MSTGSQTADAILGNGAAEVPLLDEREWSGRIYSGGWVDAPTTIETVEPATAGVA